MMKRTSLIFALILAMLMTMLPMQAMAAAGEGVTPEDGDISITIPGGSTTPAVYTVVFKDADGTVLSMQNYQYGDEVAAPAAPTKEADETYTYEFAGWDKEVTNCVGNAVYTATYTEKYIDYTVVFKAEDGTVIETQTYHYGDTVVAPEAPAKEADEQNTYEFAGWTPEIVAVAGNAEYTATYSAKAVEYTVVFKNEDGTVIETQTYKYGDAIVAPAAPTKEADENYTYEFAGWSPAVAETVTGNAEYTATFTATEIEKPSQGVITGHPESTKVKSGETVQFKVSVEGEVKSYKWEYRKVFKWFDTSMEGYNTDTLTVPATGARNGYDYRCLITFADGTQVYSELAELLVETEITDIQSPNDQTVVLGYKGQFSAEAKGESVKYRWYYQRPSSELWIETSMEGCTSATVMIETTTARDGYKYRCKITDITGLEVFTEAATMRVLSFVSHPETKFTPVGETVQFTVQTSVLDGFTYQWQYRRSETGNWENTTMAGYNTATLNVAAALTRNGYQYRCVLTGSKQSKIESKVATLYVGNPVEITVQPEAVTAAVGESAVFTVEATNVYAYQWQYCGAGSTKWFNTGAEGNTTAQLTIPVTASKNGYQYRCQIYGYDGIDYFTDAVTLTVQ